MSALHLDAEELYTDLLAGVRGLLTDDVALVGIWSGGAWLETGPGRRAPRSQPLRHGRAKVASRPTEPSP